MAERINLDDPNADLFGMNEEEISEEEMIEKQLYEKNPNRVAALGDLWYDSMLREIDGMDIPEEAKRKMIFSMTANGVLDMISDSVEEELGWDVTLSFDVYLGVLLTNKKFKVDLFEGHMKALLTVKRDDFPDDEAFELALEEFEEKWWDIPQPLLEKRTPNDAIRETLLKYGLAE
ncbi:MAG: hypothetical protein FWG60_00575 [Methanomassiliicoccaceae archaeon]|nr:hypothetical protein [Methanomassiliicoccaceae archaeon]